MPVEEILAFASIVFASIILTHPLHPLQAVRNVEIRILRELSRTDNWGNPSIFHSNRSWTLRTPEAHKLDHPKPAIQAHRL